MVLPFVWGMAAFAAPNEGASPPPTPSKDPRVKQLKIESETLQRRKERLRSNSRMAIFEDDKGVPVFTNVPQKYRNREGFVEVKIKFEPVIIPNRLRKLSERDHVSAGSVSELVRHYARIYALDENLVYAVIKAESNFQVDAVSRAGARGLMQLMPGTAAEMGVTDIFDPAQNIGGGTQYLARMLELFNRDTSLALAAYNAGPEAVKKHGGIPPYAETRAYVERVKQYHQQFGGGTVKVQNVQVVPGNKEAEKQEPIRDPKYHTVIFKSGLWQLAESITDQDPYYYVQFEGRTARVRKDQVKEIVKPTVETRLSRKESPAS